MTTLGKVAMAAGIVSVMTVSAWAQAEDASRGFFIGAERQLSNKSVQDELKASEEQKPKRNALVAQFTTAMRENDLNTRGLPKDQRTARMREAGRSFTADLHRRMPEVLTPEQIKRFTQFQIQLVGSFGFKQPLVQGREVLKKETRYDKGSTICAPFSRPQIPPPETRPLCPRVQPHAQTWLPWRAQFSESPPGPVLWCS
jgi:Spy/CpxP family protein refolding chaperone